MLVKDLIKILKGREDYEIDIKEDDLYIDDEINFISVDNNEEDNYDEDLEECNGDCCNCEFDVCLEDDNEYDENNRWRYSNYEQKDISDWDVDDHIAAWFDHMMEK